ERRRDPRSQAPAGEGEVGLLLRGQGALAVRVGDGVVVPLVKRLPIRLLSRVGGGIGIDVSGGVAKVLFCFVEVPRAVEARPLVESGEVLLRRGELLRQRLELLLQAVQLPLQSV